jgi:hypothetical protein
VAVPAEEFRREVAAEFWLLLEERVARNRRRMSRAARRVCEARDLMAVMGRPPVPAAAAQVADPDADWLAAAVSGVLPQQQEGEPGPPPWHPEHRLNPENL